MKVIPVGLSLELIGCACKITMLSSINIQHCNCANNDPKLILVKLSQLTKASLQIALEIFGC